jgi:hypothetical protein
MIPMWLKMKFRRKGEKSVTLYFPLIIAWFILLVLILLLLPVWLIASLVIFARGWGRLGLEAFPLMINTLWHLRGFLVDIQSKKETIYMQFL